MRESSNDARTCPSAHSAVLRTEARRDLKAVLAPFAGIRGWQVMRAHRDCASASGKTAAAGTSVDPWHA